MKNNSILMQSLLSLVYSRQSNLISKYEARWERDNGGADSAKCFITGKKANLEAHHVFNYSNPLFFLFRFARWNKIYLHVIAHRRYHSRYGKRFNHFGQLIMFKINYTRVYGSQFLSFSFVNKVLICMGVIQIFKMYN